MPKKDIYWHLNVNEKYFPLQIERCLNAFCLSAMSAEKITAVPFLSCLSKIVHKVLKWDNWTIGKALVAAVVSYSESFPSDLLLITWCLQTPFRSSWDKRNFAGESTLNWDMRWMLQSEWSAFWEKEWAVCLVMPQFWYSALMSLFHLLLLAGKDFCLVWISGLLRVGVWHETARGWF